MRRAIFCTYLGFVTFFAACSTTTQQKAQSQPPRAPEAQQPAEKELTPEAAPAKQARAAQAKPPRAATNKRPSAASKKTAASAQPEQAGFAPVPAAIPAGIEPAYTQPTAGVSADQPQASTARESEPPAFAARTAAPAPPPPPPAPVYLTVRAGTKIAIRLTDTLDSALAQADDSFHGTLDDELVVDGKTAAPRGSEVTGKVVTAGGSGRVKGRANLSIILTEIRIGNASYPIRTNTLSFEAESTQKQDAAKVGGGAGLGAIIGAIAGGGKGAAIGAAVGGAAGTAGVLSTKGKEVRFSREDRLAFALREDVEIRLR